MRPLLKASLSAVLSVVLGIGVLVLSGLSLKWLVIVVGAFGLACMVAISRDPERLLLILLFLILPLPIANFFGELSTIHRGGPPGYFIMLSDLPLVALCAFWLSQVIAGSAPPVRISGGVWCLLGIIGMSVISMWNAVDLRFSGYELTRLAMVFLLYLYMANAPAVPRHQGPIMAAAMLGLLAEGALGILQVASGRGVGLRLTGEGAPLVRFEGLLRAGGTLGHPNTFAIYLGLLLPVSLSLIAVSKRLADRLLASAAFIAGAAALVLTLSRGGWSGFGLSLAVWVLLVLRFRLVRGPRLAALAGVGGLLFVATVVVFQEQIYTRLLVDDDGSAYSRLPLMHVAVNMIRQHPFIGVGVNNYLLVMRQYDSTSEGIAFYFLNVVHNGYLLIAGEIGIPGLLCFLGLAVFLFRTGWKFLAREADPAPRLIVVGILAGFTSLFWQMLVENVYLTYHAILMFWALAGAVEGLSGRVVWTAKRAEAFRVARPAEGVAS